MNGKGIRGSKAKLRLLWAIAISISSMALDPQSGNLCLLAQRLPTQTQQGSREQGSAVLHA